MRRIKVVHLIGSMDLGGAEKLTRLTVEGLNAHEFSASVCCIKSGGYYAEQLRAKGFRVDELLGVDKHSRVSLAMLLRAAVRMYRAFRSDRPDIVHSHLFAASCLARIVGRLAGVKRFIVTMHRIEYPRIQPWIEGAMAPLTALYVTDSNAAADKLSKTLGIDKGRIEVIYNGIDREEFRAPPARSTARASLGLSDETFIVGVIAHLYEEKGHAFLLDSLARIQTSIPNWRLLVVGDGYLRGELERQAATLFPPGRVVFLGQRGDLVNLLSAMDVFVLPSSWEGFGIILAEAMYMRVPVITTRDGGGCAEVVVEDEGGQLIPYGDTDALGAAILRCYEDPEYRGRQGERGRKRVETLFSAETMSSSYAAIYRAIAAS